MTREDIKTINDIVHKTIYGFFDICGDKEETPMTDKDKLLLEVNKAVCNNIKDLEQEPCEDAISRQTVLDGLASIAKAKAKSDAQKSLMGRVMFFTERLPSVNPQQKTGHWKIKRASIHPYGNDVACSECGFTMGSSFGYKYCPSCGARMVESQESEG